jgi:hypothetical protein
MGFSNSQRAARAVSFGHTCNRHQGWVAIEIPHGGQVAQSVEQKTENLRVGSSILPLPTQFRNNSKLFF